MQNNFNPGFDREKLAFLELANRGGGLDPIEYIYAGDASFESVLTSYAKGGMFDINMLYVTNIDAKDISTVALKAKIATIGTAYITTIYSDNIYNKDTIESNTILAHDVTVYDSLTVGSSSLNAITNIYGPISAYSGPVSFDTSTFDILASGFSTFNFFGFEVISQTIVSVDTLSISVGAATFASFLTPLFSVNAEEFAINAVAGAIPAGSVDIFGGTKATISAPILNIGRTSGATLGADTNIMTIKALSDINLHALGVDIEAEAITIGGLTAVDYTTLFVIRANKFSVLTEGELGSAGFEIFFTAGLTNVSFTDINSYNIFANSTSIKGETFDVETTGYITLFATAETQLSGNEVTIFATTELQLEGNEVTLIATLGTQLEGTNINLIAQDSVTVNSLTANVITTGNIYLKSSGVITMDSPATIPSTPLPMEGFGALQAVPIEGTVLGDITFTLPNVVICVDGTLKTVDYVVNIVCA